VDDQSRRGKVALILFDDSTITPAQMKLTRDSAEKYVKQHMRPYDLFGVASYGLSMKILQNFTHDVGKVVEAIRQPAMSHANPVTGPRLNREDPQPGVPGACRLTARPIQRSRRFGSTDLRFVIFLHGTY
jgi:hypothetical protein